MAEFRHPLIYIILNSALNMSPGKAAAQTAHAMAALHDYRGISNFSSNVQRTVIVLEASGQQQIDNLEDYLLQLDIPSASYIDEGVNEIEAYSVTALAVGPIEVDNLEVRDIFKAFPLYGKPKKKTPWWRRLFR